MNIFLNPGMLECRWSGVKWVVWLEGGSVSGGSGRAEQALAGGDGFALISAHGSHGIVPEESGW